MPNQVRSNRMMLIGVWFFAGLFVLGFFNFAVGAWTGPILGVWFVLSQRVRRGFVLLLAFGIIPDMVMHLQPLWLAGPEQAPKQVALLFLAAVLGTLPLVFHRLVSPRLPGLLATLPFPAAAAGLGVFAAYLPGMAGENHIRLAHLFILWFAALVVWLWHRESRATVWVAGAGACAGLTIAAVQRFNVIDLAANPVLGLRVELLFVVAAALLAAYAVLRGAGNRSWANRSETIALLESPVTHQPLTLRQEGGREFLASRAGEEFPIEDGIPNFLKAADLTGDNGKYNRLYQTIGGFYDDTQRVACALRGVDRDSYFLNYMSLLEVKPADSVLETSVGTGLNFRYLPRGVKLSGLDLSPEMLVNCRANMRRWGMDADLYLGNAESLPFADSSFDVVFHVGGISFFNDKGKAIREMIRVAKPGSLILIEDETEEYAKSTYEKIPITSSYYKNRESVIHVPIDLVPREMEEIKLEMLKEGKFYAITFRKPAV